MSEIINTVLQVGCISLVMFAFYLYGFERGRKSVKQSAEKDDIKKIQTAVDVVEALSNLPNNTHTDILKARYNAGEKQFNLGLIDEAEFMKIKTGILNETGTN